LCKRHAPFSPDVVSAVASPSLRVTVSLVDPTDPSVVFCPVSPCGQPTNNRSAGAQAKSRFERFT
jgi:hypothetical protein